jgi:hypothetical protein
MDQLQCIDVYPQKDFNANESKQFKAIFVKDNIWETGQEGDITITFGDYPCDSCGTNSNWSKIGNSILTDTSIPSMNLSTLDPPFGDFILDGKTYNYNLFKHAKRNSCELGLNQNSCSDYWFQGGTILHEFCHALGMLHEHQSYQSPMVFNEEEVYNYMTKPENGGWSREKTKHNFIDRYECTPDNCPYDASVFDPKSIMIYSIPESFLLEGEATNNYFTLSELDKQWLTNKYPLNEPNPPVLSVVFVDGEEWKRAWTEWVIREYLQPYVGIRFRFDRTLPPIAPGETYPPGAIILDNIVEWSSETIIGVVLAAFLFLAIIIILFF